MKTITRAVLLSLVAIAGLLETPVRAQAAVEREILANSDPILARRYREGAEEIEALRAIALDKTKDSDQRTAALRELARKYPDAVLTPAAELVTDPDTPVAVFAAQRLASAAVMSDHPATHANDEAVPPYLRLMMWRHRVAREGLRLIVQDPRPEVKTIAATSLATLSDSIALDKIEAGRNSGVYSDIEAANYFGLADPEVGVPYIQELLRGGSPEAQATAVSYLGSNPAYQELVRNEYLLNSDAPVQVRSAAAAALGQYDSSFTSYATTLTADPALPPEVYKQVIQGYIAQSRGELQPTEADALKTAVENYSKDWPDADLSDVLETLKSITPE
jgi:hypothetical protein